ncbi:UbiA family prenyltransferase [Colwelliaceae bacterium MEBiC 14330]
MGIITLLKLVRAPAGFTALSNILAAAIIATSGQLSTEIILLCIASVCFYFAGMALNDCFDYKIDLAERASRPIPQGLISINKAWIVGFSLLAFALLFAYIHSMTSLLFGLILACCILLYNGVIKDGLAGSILMASCRYLNWIFGATIITLTLNSYLFALPILFYIIGLTYLSKQEVQATNKNAVFFTAAMLLLCTIAMLFLTGQVVLTVTESIIAYSLISLWFGLNSFKLATVFKEFTPQNIQKMITWLIIGVIPLDALMVIISGHYVLGCLLLALLPPCRFFSKKLAMT